MSIVSRAQMTICDVSINLRGRDVAVTKQSLHRTGISPMLHQVSSEAVAERVWRYSSEAGTGRMLLYSFPGELSSYGLAAVREEIR